MADKDCQSCLEFLSRVSKYDGQSKKEWLEKDNASTYDCPKCGSKTKFQRTWIIFPSLK
jgi:predicted RNA-binding Zn-ribbon protein involved in translation (DUF1610 family)